MSTVADTGSIESKWAGYFEWTSKGEKPWPTLAQAVELFNEEDISLREQPVAVDLGCSVGKDASHLLKNDWNILPLIL